MALGDQILFIFCILYAAAHKNKPNKCYGGHSLNTTSSCTVAINETVCLVCNISDTNPSASWMYGNDKIYRSNHFTQSANELPDSYRLGCHSGAYSLNVSRSRVPDKNISYFCRSSNSSVYGFEVKTVESQQPTKPELHLTDTNEPDPNKNRSGDLIPLYISVPSLFIASILTSVILYFKAKNYRQRKAEKTATDGDIASISPETNYAGTGLLYSDINEEDTKTNENSATVSKAFEAVLNTRIKTSGTFEYWSAEYVADSSDVRSSFAKTLSSHATMKDATMFQEHAVSLNSLNNSHFLVQLLSVSVDELPYAIYYEYMECGTLRDFMLRRYQQARKSRISVTTENPEMLPANVQSQIEELLTFASMIAEALQFITSQNFSHPALSLKKVLLSEYCECKLYDIYSTEMAMKRIQYLMGKNDPPVAWMAVETIFLQEYQTSSDVWSFAVLLWELFSLGDVPYARNTREEIEQKIRDGVVLMQPLSCPGAVYGIMLSCWNNAARKRPTCDSLLRNIKEMVQKFKERERDLATVSEEPDMPYFVLDPNEARNNYI